MDIEDRISKLEEIVLNDGFKVEALDMLVRALIVSHPDRALVLQLGKAILKSYEDQVREDFFERGHTADSTKRTLDSVQKHVLRLLELAR